MIGSSAPVQQLSSGHVVVALCPRTVETQRNGMIKEENLVMVLRCADRCKSFAVLVFRFVLLDIVRQKQKQIWIALCGLSSLFLLFEGTGVYYYRRQHPVES